MQIKKSGGKIFGAVMSKAEQKAMEMEINRQMAEIDRQNMMEIDAIILWELHEQFGFGVKRLKTFHDNFVQRYKDLISRYEMDSEDGPWLCKEKLKEIGVDLESWAAELDETERIDI